MQAIETKFIGASNTKPARINVSCQALRIMVNWEDDLTQELNHRLAAQKMILLLGWTGLWCSGHLRSLPNSEVHVCFQRIESGWHGNVESWGCWKGMFDENSQS